MNTMFFHTDLAEIMSASDIFFETCVRQGVGEWVCRRQQQRDSRWREAVCVPPADVWRRHQKMFPMFDPIFATCYCASIYIFIYVNQQTICQFAKYVKYLSNSSKDVAIPDRSSNLFMKPSTWKRPVFISVANTVCRPIANSFWPMYIAKQTAVAASFAPGEYKLSGLVRVCGNGTMSRNQDASLLKFMNCVQSTIKVGVISGLFYSYLYMHVR